MAGGRLTDYKIQTAKAGRHGDGRNLYLQVRGPMAKSWIFRYRDAAGFDRAVGLGPWPVVSLEEARAAALEIARMRREGRDPLAEKLARNARLEVIHAITFRDAAAKVITMRAAEWKSPKHKQQWENTLTTYVYPRLGDVDVKLIDSNHVVDVLAPIWTTKIETASRLRERIAAVLAWCAAKGFREGANPADMERLKNLLPSQKKVKESDPSKQVQHHAALAYTGMHDFMARVRERPATAARCLELCVLTGARTANAIGMRWDHVDLDHAVWKIPAAEMKISGNGEHAVPLSRQVVTLLKAQQGRDKTYVFPSQTPEKPLSNMAMLQLIDRMGHKGEVTAHGFRSTLTDWAREETTHEPDTVRLQLAHAIDSKVDAAYRRGDLYRKRAALMQDWADYIDTEPPQAVVTPIHAKRGA
ncbi:tyrosine-type recombinase/integrase [Paraburkholderia saeva]|uniref:Prophage integrase IntA n=1 Tax=Paraburkholderia saeva TaxID=2777537 RepID=A0A9N8RXY7_9BURK|nr:site-specific integrase [Paraburkholderia saeva]CAG4900940.1 Prophage integrase IntA [Paraburkholderia saeva]